MKTATTALKRAGRSLRHASTGPPSPAAIPAPQHLLSLADLSTSQMQTVLTSAAAYKRFFKGGSGTRLQDELGLTSRPLEGKTVALMFSKRSTRTRVASESATALLGGHPLFLGSNDIQLGVNETLYDTSRVVSSMVDGIFARVGPHSDIETLSANSAVPVINALSDLYHPTQILADLLTLIETYSNPFVAPSLSSLSGLKIAWIGDSNNILNDMLLSFPRLNIDLSIATPKGYGLDQSVLDLSATCTKAEGGKGKISHTHDPLEAVSDADVVVTDTWISMGQEEEYDRRIRDFSGFQITSEMMKRGGAKPDWKFMHCLPRKQQEVDDEVFYSDRSLVFPEAENRKWTTIALFGHYFAPKGRTL